MPNGKTIRQIADEIGVTRQAIYKKFKLHSAIANNIKAYSFTVDRVKYYTTEGEKIIKSLFTNNYDVPQETADVSTEQFTSDNLTTAKVDRLTHQLTDELTGLQDDKTRIKSVFSDSSTQQTTADVSTEQLTSVNLTTAKVDRLTHQLTVLFSAQLTTKDKQLEEKDRQLAEKDKQIALLMEQTNNLTQALQAAQALAAADFSYKPENRTSNWKILKNRKQPKKAFSAEYSESKLKNIKIILQTRLKKF